MAAAAVAALRSGPGSPAATPDADVATPPSSDPRPDGGPSAPPPAALRCADDMALIPAGAFTTGLPDALRAPADPPRERRAVRAFCVDRVEVTLGDWLRCRAAGACADPPRDATEDVAGVARARAAISARCAGSMMDAPRHERLPMNCVDYTSAQAFCAWRGRRLPTEDEWELAARGREGRPLPWGDAAPDAERLNACGRECVAALRAEGYRGSLSTMYDLDDGADGPAPVGSHPAGATPEGVMDLAGNVAEWVTRTRALDADVLQVVRGGSWFSARAVSVYPALRLAVRSDRRNPQTGFRCAADVGR
ncbi:MAG: formylglycine-generating enzyme family protein [Polyangiales bacterium]